MFKLFKINRQKASDTHCEQLTAYQLLDEFYNLDTDPYITIKKDLSIISIFDDTRYDRSDFDHLSPAMRRYISKKLKMIGFKHVSGRVFEHKQGELKCEIPKSSVLGASPFHATDYTNKQGQDFHILTPTQTACVIINSFATEQAVERIVQLVQQQPINLFKIKDFLEQSQAHETFKQAIPHIKYKQRIAVESPPLNTLRCLS